MSILLVLVAHDGRTLQLDVQGATRVDAVQQALVSVTGISVSDQIVMCHGARLDPAKPLSAYKLPVPNPAAAEDQPVFLYHKAYLRPGAAPPPLEPLPILEVTVPGLPSVGLRHPLQAAHSPLIRALPDYEAQFTQQLGEARAYWEASQQRLHKCRQLMSEQEVQARAADAARANVESHYNYIASMYTTFVDKYVSQHRQHSKLLSQFASLSAAMATVELPSQLVTPHWRVLADLQPNRARLAEWNDSCSRSHEQFAQKVSELENVFQQLRREVERLFLQAPSVDLDALGVQLNEAESLIDEQGSIVQVLSKDLLTVRQLVEDVVAQLGGSAGGASLSGAAVHDTCAAVDTMHDNHLQSLLPRVRTADASIAEFLLRCGDAKARMTRDVLEQLQGIAAQQSKIRDMKHKLAVFNEVLTRQAVAFNELQATTRLPAAYRLALAECARRAAWQEMFAGQASRLAEHCGRITAKEAAKRESVRRQLEKHLPIELLAKAGLLQEPPHCMVSVPPSEAFLLPVTPADISRLPAIIHQAAEAATAAPGAAGSSAQQARAAADAVSSSRLVAAPSSSGGGQQPSRTTEAPSTTPSANVGASMMIASTWGLTGRPEVAAATAAVGAAGSSPGSNLALENARLRAELAALLAQQAARELGDEVAGAGSSSSSSAAGRTSTASTVLAAAQAPSASISLAASSSVAATLTRGGVAADATAAPVASGSSAAAPAKLYGHGGQPVVPASVAAPVPSVVAALQQVQENDEQQVAASAAQQALTLAPVQAALAAKDELVACLDVRCSALAAEVSGYEARIAQLEAQLSAHFSSTTSQQQQSDGSQQQATCGALHERQQGATSTTAEAAAPSAMAQSVAPAFVLDATQAPSFFGVHSTHPSGGVGGQVLKHPAAVEGDRSSAAAPTLQEAAAASGQPAAAPATSSIEASASQAGVSFVSLGQSSAPEDATAQPPEGSQEVLKQQQPEAAPQADQQKHLQSQEVSASGETGEAATSKVNVAEESAVSSAGTSHQAATAIDSVHTVTAAAQRAAAADNVDASDSRREAGSSEAAQAAGSEAAEPGAAAAAGGSSPKRGADGIEVTESNTALTGGACSSISSAVDTHAAATSGISEPAEPAAVALAGGNGSSVAYASDTASCEGAEAAELAAAAATPGGSSSNKVADTSKVASPAGAADEDMTAVHEGHSSTAIDEDRDVADSSSKAGSSGEQQPPLVAECSAGTAGSSTSPEAARTAEQSNAAAQAAAAAAVNPCTSDDVQPSTAGADEASGAGDLAATPDSLQQVAVAAAAAPGTASLSASEPDLRAVMVAQPAEVEAERQQQQLQMPTRSSSVDSQARSRFAHLQNRQGSSRRSADGAMPTPPTVAVTAASSGTGLSSLLTSSMHFLFHRTSRSSGDSSSSGSANSPPVVSPPMSPPPAAAWARRHRVGFAEAEGSELAEDRAAEDAA